MASHYIELYQSVALLPCPVLCMVNATSYGALLHAALQMALINCS